MARLLQKPLDVRARHAVAIGVVDEAVVAEHDVLVHAAEDEVAVVAAEDRVVATAGVDGVGVAVVLERGVGEQRLAEVVEQVQAGEWSRREQLASLQVLLSPAPAEAIDPRVGDLWSGTDSPSATLSPSVTISFIPQTESHFFTYA